jgi:hypothetical protein
MIENKSNFALFINIMIVITKAGEIRLNESLATSYFFNEKGATFYSKLSEKDNSTIFFPVS